MRAWGCAGDGGGAEWADHMEVTTPLRAGGVIQVATGAVP